MPSYVVCCHKTRFLHVLSQTRSLWSFAFWSFSDSFMGVSFHNSPLHMWSETRGDESQGHVKGCWSVNYEGFGHALSPTSVVDLPTSVVDLPTSVVDLPTSVVDLRQLSHCWITENCEGFHVFCKQMWVITWHYETFDIARVLVITKFKLWEFLCNLQSGWCLPTSVVDLRPTSVVTYHVCCNHDTLT
jgi:hypothetical protein